MELETTIEHFKNITFYPLHQDAYIESKVKAPTASHGKGVAGEGQLSPDKSILANVSQNYPHHSETQRCQNSRVDFTDGY